MPCAAYQALFNADRRIWEAWKQLRDKKNRSVSENEEMHSLVDAGVKSCHAVSEHVANCSECKSEDEKAG